jgi:hypothetical protein
LYPFPRAALGETYECVFVFGNAKNGGWPNHSIMSSARARIEAALAGKSSAQQSAASARLLRLHHDRARRRRTARKSDELASLQPIGLHALFLPSETS